MISMILDLLHRAALWLALVLGLLALGPVLAWCAQNQLGPALVAVAIAAQAQHPPQPALLPAGQAIDLLTWQSDRDLLAMLLSQEVR